MRNRQIFFFEEQLQRNLYSDFLNQQLAWQSNQGQRPNNPPPHWQNVRTRYDFD